MARKAVGRVLKLWVKALRGPRKGTEYVRHFKTQRGYEKALKAGARTIGSRVPAVAKKAKSPRKAAAKKLAQVKPKVILRPFSKFDQMGLKPGTKKWMKYWQANPDKQAAMSAYAEKLRTSAR
jgi:hypothetical protein